MRMHSVQIMMDPSHVFVIVDTLEMGYHVKVSDRMRLRAYRFKISTLFISMHHGGTATHWGWGWYDHWGWYDQLCSVFQQVLDHWG